MGRKQRGERVLGPYYESRRNEWKVILAGNGDKRTWRFQSKAEAQEYKKILEQEIVTVDHTTQTAAVEYIQYLKDEGNKETSTDRTEWSIKKFFPVPLPLWSLTEKKGQKRYDELQVEPSATGNPLSVDSHRNALAEVKTFPKLVRFKTLDI